MRYETFSGGICIPFRGGLNQDVRDGRIDQDQFQSSSGNSDSIGEHTQQELTLIREHIT